MTAVRTSPLLSRPGAVAADPPDEGVAAHYGDPFREQRRLSEGRGLVDLSHREVLCVSGADRLSWLHSLTTQHLSALAPGVATDALVLSPHGHVEHHLALLDDGESVWMHVEPGTSSSLMEFLDRMRFLLRVEVSDVTQDWAVVFEPVAVAHPVHRTRVLAWGRERFVPRGDLDQVATDAGETAGTWAHEALRVVAHRPRLGRETDHRTIVQEVGWISSAVHLQKGCYRGQETVARVTNLGRPPRRLVMLHLDGSVDSLPVHGDPVALGERQVGFVTTAVRHFELGPVALALIKRNVPVEATLLAGGVPGTQEVVVPA